MGQLVPHYFKAREEAWHELIRIDKRDEVGRYKLNAFAP
jgi:hypothetical protein